MTPEPSKLTPDERDAYEERCAIMQFDAHMTRAQAERRAWAVMFPALDDHHR